MRDVLRLETILHQKGLTTELVYLQIAICAQHNEQSYSLRFPSAMRFLYGSAEGGRVSKRFGSGSAE